MTNRKPLNDKILLLGLDGMDPRLTRKYVDAGLMPNTAEFIRRGSARKDLVMLGGHPTVTPPMWTTLACGCYANVHGITDFCRLGGDIDKVAYNFDSRLCKAEQLWNVFAEAGKKTLVWHWPGSAWPPSSDNPNLYVVDGTSPGSVGMSVAQIEGEYLLSANVNQPDVTFRRKAASEANAACVITGLELEEDDGKSLLGKIGALKSEEGHTHVITDFSQGTSAATENALDLALSPVKDAYGWTEAPEDAKEFTVLLSGGLIRRPALILKGEDGKYDRVAIYKSKKDLDPIVVLTPHVMAAAFRTKPSSATKNIASSAISRSSSWRKMARSCRCTSPHPWTLTTTACTIQNASTRIFAKTSAIQRQLPTLAARATRSSRNACSTAGTATPTGRPKRSII